MGRLNTFLGRLEWAGKLAEDALLVLILSTMVLLAAGQIILRNFLDVGFIWGDELLRMLVLWLAVAGALAASRSDKHISIDVLNRFLPERATLAVKVVGEDFSIFVNTAILNADTGTLLNCQMILESYKQGMGISFRGGDHF